MIERTIDHRTRETYGEEVELVEEAISTAVIVNKLIRRSQLSGQTGEKDRKGTHGVCDQGATKSKHFQGAKQKRKESSRSNGRESSFNCLRSPVT